VSAQGGHADVVALLLGAGAAVDTETSKAGTPGFGPVSDATVENGTTALFATAWQGHEAVARMLLDAGADKTKRTPWGSAAEFATKHGHAALAQLLS
jgi:ankyrin repeat protein